MATGPEESKVNAFIDGVVADGTWIQLHVGDPGAAGTSNVATNDTRKEASFAAAADGEAVTDGDLVWSNAPDDEDYTHFTMWTAETDGTFLWSGTVTANPVFTGESLVFPAGNLALTATYAQ